MLRITPDTNIYISAFMFGGKPLRLLEMALEGEVRLAISDAILEEALGVLRDKFGLAPERLLEAEGFIKDQDHEGGGVLSAGAIIGAVICEFAQRVTVSSPHTGRLYFDYASWWQTSAARS